MADTTITHSHLRLVAPPDAAQLEEQREAVMGDDPVTCVRCGRVMPQAEAMVGDEPHCHPDDPRLPDCYFERTVLHREPVVEPVTPPGRVKVEGTNYVAPDAPLGSPPPETFDLLRVLAASITHLNDEYATVLPETEMDLLVMARDACDRMVTAYA